MMPLSRLSEVTEKNHCDFNAGVHVGCVAFTHSAAAAAAAASKQAWPVGNHMAEL